MTEEPRRRTHRWAFAALPAGTRDSLLLPGHRDRSTAIPTCHAAPAAQPGSGPGGTGGEIAAIGGKTLPMDGTAHVIDAVLLP